MTAPTPSGRECPHPEKIKFLDREQAQRHVGRTNLILVPVPRVPYWCVCGYCHVTTDKKSLRRATVESQ